MIASLSLWPVVDWFLPPNVREGDTDQLRRLRMLVSCLLLMIPTTLFGIAELYALGTLVADQARFMWILPAIEIACLLVLKFTRAHVFVATVFCLHLIGGAFYLATTDLGLRDPILLWTILVPMIAAFVVGPWLSLTCAVLLVGTLIGLYELEVYGIYEPPFLSTPAEDRWFTLLSLLTTISFSALLAWLYEGYTVRRLRRMNRELMTLRTELEASELRYRSVFENMPVGMYRSTREGRIVMANTMLRRMLGLEEGDAINGIDANALYEDPAQRELLLNRLEAEGEVQAFVYSLRNRTGEMLRVRENAHVTLDEHGEVLYYEGVIEDVTALHRAELAAQRTEERYRALVQYATDTITILDGDGVVRYQSPSIALNLGYTPEDTVGLAFSAFVHPEDARRVRILFERALRRPGDFGSIEFRYRHAEGHYIYLEAKGTNMLDNPVVQGVVLNSRDVTERKRAEVALVRAKEQAEEVAHLKSVFLANMSHEIRTPLTGIIGFAEVLAEEVEAEQREFVSLIEKSGQRLLQTLNSVLDLARLEANQMEIELEPMDLGQQAREAVRLLQPLAEEKGLALDVRIEDGEALARVDQGCITRVINNLVGNAIKFTEAGHVTVAVKTSASHVQLAIADTGIGIDEAFLPHLFDEFRQESTGLVRKHEGSGLGLTITRRLVELMHGSIEVESSKGEGSTFTVSFPRLRKDVAAAPVVIAPPRRPRILVVDDNESTLALMERMLRDRAITETVTTPEQAMENAEAAERPYDLLFLDIHLGGAISGADLMRQFRERPAYTDTPIVAFTAFALPGDRERFLNAGFSGYLGKPFSRQELMALLDELLPQEPAPEPIEATFTFLSG